MFSEYKNQHGNVSFVDVNEVVGVGTMNDTKGEITSVTLQLRSGSWLICDFPSTAQAYAWLQAERQRLAAPFGYVVSVADTATTPAADISGRDRKIEKLVREVEEWKRKACLFEDRMSERMGEINTLRDAAETWKSTAQSEACVNQALREENARLDSIIKARERTIERLSHENGELVEANKQPAKIGPQPNPRRYHAVIARRSTGMLSFGPPTWIELNIETAEIVEHSLSALEGISGCVVMTPGGDVYFVQGYSANELQALKRESVGK